MAGSTQRPTESALIELVEIMARLRAECGWKAAQTHRTLAKHLLEETYETLEAIEAGDPDHLREELGDVLLQVYLHAAIADQAGEFDIEDVARGLLEKMIRRNPHVFGDLEETDPARINESWEALKAAEKQRTGLLDGIPLELPGTEPRGQGPRPAGARRQPLPPRPGRRQTTWATGSSPSWPRPRESGVDPEQALRDAVRRVSA